MSISDEEKEKIRSGAINQNQVRILFDCDKETGILTWIKRISTRGVIGSCAGTSCADGYIKIRIFGYGYAAHRLVWLFFNGDYGDFEIDHIDNNKSNNSLSNLRLASKSENQRNKPIQKNNTSGVKGVSWNKRAKKWKVEMKKDGKSIYFGYYSDFELAKKVAINARIKLHGEFANHGIKVSI